MPAFYQAPGIVEDAISRVLAATQSTDVTIDLRLTSSVDPDFTVPLTFLEHFTVVQDHFRDYGDHVTCMARVSGPNLQKIQSHLDSLEAVVRITKVGTTVRRKNLAVPPIIRRYRVLVMGNQDLAHSIPKAEGFAEDTLPLTLQLIPRLIYDTRMKRFNGILRNSTLSSAIAYIAQSFGIKTLSLIPPDNRHVYDHLVIPPSFAFSEIFGYLQDTYGVYENGLSYYLEDNVLYIYPPFDITSETTKVAHLYMDTPAGHPGGVSYHRVTDEGITEIVMQGTPTIVDLSQVGGENLGTSYMFSRANKALDNYIEVDADGNGRYTHRTSMIMSMDNARLATPGRDNIMHADRPTDNMYALRSNLVKYQAQTLTCGWPQAAMGLLHPGQRIVYVHASEKHMARSKGILEAIAFDYVRQDSIGDGDWAFTCNSKLRFRIAPSETQSVQ